MFKFHRIGNDVASGWYCLIDSQKAMNAHSEYMIKRVLINWKDIKNSPENKWGHCRTSEAGQWKDLLLTKMEMEEIEKMDMFDCLEFMGGPIRAAMNILKEKGKVYVSANGACRPSTKLMDCEDILEEKELDNYVFPSYSEKEFKIRRWQGGKHYYILEDGNSISLYGRSKWNTYKGAEEALEDHKKQLRRQDARNKLQY